LNSYSGDDSVLSGDQSVMRERHWLSLSVSAQRARLRAFRAQYAYCFNLLQTSPFKGGDVEVAFDFIMSGERHELYEWLREHIPDHKREGLWIGIDDPDLALFFRMAWT